MASRTGPMAPAQLEWLVAVSHRQTRTSSMLLLTIKMERSTCPKQSMYAVDVVALGTMRSRCVTTGLPCCLRGTECEDEESRAVRMNMPSVPPLGAKWDFEFWTYDSAQLL